ncbi:DUF3219 family protein [Ornithinibacillus xuwenensis]|uniref:DUF3219 family protein n=1 Tax=Ornithinibacillus xuwenensis TaxID=3144668 RepID=A0ABU9XFN8_9BACI
MNTTVLINSLSVAVEQLDYVDVEKEDNNLKRLTIAFKVTNQQYHDVTVELYKNDFRIRVPERNIDFQAAIENYFTSATNLYEENAVGDFNVTFVEKKL